MGQTHFKGKKAQDFLMKYTVADLKALKPGKATLSVIMNDQGGVKDDCIITKVTEEHFYVVLNAGCKDKDLDHFRSKLPEWNN
jgi:aminomethyltransferase